MSEASRLRHSSAATTAGRVSCNPRSCSIEREFVATVLRMKDIRASVRLSVQSMENGDDAVERGKMSTAYIAVGSNLGDKQSNCEKGIAALNQTQGITVNSQAKLYKTAPVDFTDQDWFVNTAVRVVTDLAPRALLKQLKRIENAAGRIKSDIRFGPRVLDLDIIFYDNLVLNSDTLEIPHPRMHKRRFVLRPICDIDPAAMHPKYKKTVANLLDGIADPDQEITAL